MGLFSFFERSVDLKDHLRQTKTIKINGIRFEIKKISLDDHLEGLNVILKLRDVYKKEKPKDRGQIIQDEAKIRKFMRDFIYAGVVKPQLSMKTPPEPDAIHVDEVTRDLDLSQKLCTKIIEYAYGKKK